MSDWMGDYWPEEWTRLELQMMRDNPQHRFYTLTKQPQNLPKWFPSRHEGGHVNCWVGATVTDDSMMEITCNSFDALWSPVRFISFEPLLGRLSKKSLKQIRDYVCQWLIIGSCTGTKAELVELQKEYPELTLMPYGKKWTLQPKIEWIQEIVEAADRAGVAVFLKDDLSPLAEQNKQLFYSRPHPEGIELLPTIRQELPDAKTEDKP
jgi:protein gp37